MRPPFDKLRVSGNMKCPKWDSRQLAYGSLRGVEADIREVGRHGDDARVPVALAGRANDEHELQLIAGLRIAGNLRVELALIVYRVALGIDTGTGLWIVRRFDEPKKERATRGRRAASEGDRTRDHLAAEAGLGLAHHGRGSCRGATAG